MCRLRRPAALLVSLLLVHLALVTSGFACVMPGMGASTQATMAGMAMPGMHMSNTDMAGMGTLTTSDADQPAPDHAPCRFPWAPDGCQSMAPCAPMALTAHAPALRAADRVPSAAFALAVVTPPSEVRPPELPPPRA